MKKLFLSTLLSSGIAASAFAQGFVALDNTANTDQSPSALSNGLFWLNNGAAIVKMSGDFNAAFYGGTDQANLSLIATFSGAGAAGSGFSGAGTWGDPNGQGWAIPGSTVSGTAFMRVEAWDGSATSYALALAGGAHTAQSIVFSNPMKALPDAPPNLTGMPAVVLSAVPEPSTFALAGLGAAALLIFRRRK